MAKKVTLRQECKDQLSDIVEGIRNIEWLGLLGTIGIFILFGIFLLGLGSIV